MADGVIFSPQTGRLVLEVVKYMQAAGFMLKAGQQSPPSGLYAPGPVFIRNESDEEIPAYACVQSTGTEESGDGNYVLVDKPADTSWDAGVYFFNGPSPIEKMGDGLAFSGPFVRALIDETSTVSSGLRYSPTVDEWYLSEDSGGILIAVGEDDVSENIARVYVGSSGGAGLFICRLNEPWSSNAADADIYTIDGSSYTDTGEDKTVYDPLGIFSSLTTDDYGLCLLQGGKYYLIQAPCPE